MKRESTIEAMWQWREENKNKKIAFVGTMGNLHAGHLALVEYAKSISDYTVVSIFVNPLQFSANEDFDTYPKTLTSDEEKLSALHCDLLFTPTPNALYPHGLNVQTQVFVPELSHILCGMTRPHFFQGVTTVVAKLFNIVKPDVAIFGEKDYQQLRVIQQMVNDLHFQIEIIGRPIVREADGLAMSSRNQYLTSTERNIACALNEELNRSAELIKKGESDFDRLCSDAKSALSKRGFQPDYYEICKQGDLARAKPNDKEIIILAAAHLGKARLIDNIKIQTKF